MTVLLLHGWTSCRGWHPFPGAGPALRKHRSPAVCLAADAPYLDLVVISRPTRPPEGRFLFGHADSSRRHPTLPWHERQLICNDIVLHRRRWKGGPLGSRWTCPFWLAWRRKGGREGGRKVERV